MAIFWIFLLFCDIVCSASKVFTPYGVLNGFIWNTRNGQRGRAFFGVKYGFAPRFKKPFPITFYANADATSFGPLCPQINGRLVMHKLGTKMNEDCLYLNIYAPENSSNCSVLIWLESSLLQVGHGNFDPEPVFDRFVSRGIIFVSVQFRQSYLGFSNFNFNKLQANFDANVGVHDVLLAIKWIKKNILSFGGDPAKITLFGHGAGACLASNLILSGAFQGNIALLSGTSETCFDGSFGYRDITSRLVQAACSIDTRNKLNVTNLEKIELCIDNREAMDVIERFDEPNVLGWPLVVDQRLFAGTPQEMTMIRTRMAPTEHAPKILLGMTRDEWAALELSLMNTGRKHLDSNNYNEKEVIKFISQMIAFAFERSQLTAKLRKIVHEYHFAAVNKDPAAWLETVSTILTDAFYSSKIAIEALRYAGLNYTVYLYEFSEAGTKFTANGYKPVLHGDDVKLLFGRAHNPAAEAFANVLTNFVTRTTEPSLMPLNHSEWNYAEIDGCGITGRKDFRRMGRELWLKDLKLDFPRPSREAAWANRSLTLF